MPVDKEYCFPFEKLDVWHKSKELVAEIYSVTGTYPDKERFGFISQLNRSALSIASNIAEGTSRTSKKEQAHFTEIAYGSLMEIACQLIISNELGYLLEEDLKRLRIRISEISRMLVALRSYQKRNS